MTEEESINDGNDDFGKTLSWLEYRLKDQQNGGNRTIRINSNPQWIITLKRNRRRYSQQAIENLVYSRLDKLDLDYGGTDTVSKCVKDIMWQVNNGKEEKEEGDGGEDDNTKTISVPDTIRVKSGRVRTVGTIVGVSQPYNIVDSIKWTCPMCGDEDMTELDPPLPFFHSPRRKCSNKGCRPNNNDPVDLIAEPSHETAKSVSLQDSEPTDDLEKLHVVLQGDKDTRNVKVGERVLIMGDMYVLRAYPNNILL